MKRFFPDDGEEQDLLDELLKVENYIKDSEQEELMDIVKS